MTDEQRGLTVAVLSPGAMGSAVAARLVGHGARVLTSLDGRSDRSAARARAAGMIDASDREIAGAGLILSIVPPGEAEPLVRRLLPHLEGAAVKPLFIDCNALSPDSKRGLAALLAGVGCTMLDGVIIGPPPAEGRAQPRFYVSGERAQDAVILGRHGIDLCVLDGPIGAASALKMCFGGINKGLVGLGSAMLLAAERAGAADALGEEMAASMPDLLGRFRHQVPDMYPKAYRWVAEMREIAAFLSEDPAAAMLFEGMAQLYERLAADVAGAGTERDALDAALGRD